MAVEFQRQTGPNGVTFLVCPALPVRHGFSLRTGGVSRGEFASLNLGRSSGDDLTDVAANRDRWQAALGLTQPVFSLHQVHGAVLHHVDADTAAQPGEWQGDALFTRQTGRAIGVFTADCAPLLLASSDGTAVAAVHAGWRGTVAGAAGATVAAFEAAGISPDQLTVAVGPTIGPCCFEVGTEVVETFAATPWYDPAIVRPGTRGNPHLDLFTALEGQLRWAGVPADAIHLSRLCTACDADAFYSWRRDGGRSGRHLATIVCGARGSA
ncbi:MAG: peptidoglycan editing factor PgeF [Candidatus Sericytochromatia bacterium]|nr:peptidoglycan editing factor PgeF [Candidatus Sericytochromatia bacterium]